MDISVRSTNNNFELSLDACTAKLNAYEMLLLRENLSKELLKPLKKTAGFWEEQQAQLDELKYIAFALAELDENSLENIVISNVWCEWIPLLAFTLRLAIFPNSITSAFSKIKRSKKRRYSCIR